MSWYRRRTTSGGTYFFTVVTHGRQPLFESAPNRALLRAAIAAQRKHRPFDLVAAVLLPDHLHTIWTLPPGDCDYSTRWRRIKSTFTDGFLAAGGIEATISDARAGRGERGVWQRRFWEHECRDADDVKRCLDYIHWNPVKHGYASRAVDYPYSTFQKYVRLGEYDRLWGTGVTVEEVSGAEWE